jgi:hypothetical protein
MIATELLVTVMPCGHGDCIILEWINNGESQIGIIDCNKGNQNPKNVFEYISIKGYKKIEFLIISHTHDDHYSGVYELIELFNLNQIEIEEFRYTHNKPLLTESHILEHAKTTHYYNDYLKASLINLLRRVMKYSKQLNNNNGIINIVNRIGYSVNIALNNELEIRCITPSDIEEGKYNQYQIVKPLKNKSLLGPKNNPATNYLSTFLILKNKENKNLAFFSSDIELLFLML